MLRNAQSVMERDRERKRKRERERERERSQREKDREEGVVRETKANTYRRSALVF